MNLAKKKNEKCFQMIDDQRSNPHSYFHLCRPIFLSLTLINTNSLCWILCWMQDNDISDSNDFGDLIWKKPPFVNGFSNPHAVTSTLTIQIIIPFTHIHTATVHPNIRRILSIRKHMQMYFVSLFIRSSHSRIIREYDLTVNCIRTASKHCASRAHFRITGLRTCDYTPHITHIFGVYASVWFSLFRFGLIFCRFQAILKFSSNVYSFVHAQNSEKASI